MSYSPQQPAGYVPYATVEPTGKDVEHLRLLSIFHYVAGGLTMLLSSVFIVHILMGVFMVQQRMPLGPPSTQPSVVFPSEFGWMFIIFGSIAVALGWSMGLATILSGRWIARRKNRLASMIIAGVNCVSVPIGTALGVFTLVVLLKESVRMLYAARSTGTQSDLASVPPQM